MRLLDCDDQQRELIIERGECDLYTFVKLRRKQNDPLDTNELFLIIQYVAECMKSLHEIGVSLCDTKEQNILIRFSKEHIGYVLALTDLGGVYC